jgi:hypothetical protein
MLTDAVVSACTETGNNDCINFALSRINVPAEGSRSHIIPGCCKMVGLRWWTALHQYCQSA